MARGKETTVTWKEQSGPFMPGRLVDIKTKSSHNLEDGKIENTVSEYLVTIGQMGSSTIEVHPGTMFGKTFGEKITIKAIEHSQNAECMIWFGLKD